MKVKKTVTRKARPQTAKAPTTYGKYIQQHQSSKMGQSNAGQTSERGRPSISQSKRRRSKKAKKPAQTIQPPEQQMSPTGAQADIPIFNEEYLNQLNEEQLQELLQRQRALMQQQQLAAAPTQHTSHSISKPRQRSAGKRSSSADRKTRQQRAKDIYGQPAISLNTIPTGNMGGGPQSQRVRKSSSGKRKGTRKGRKGAQPGQGNSVMLNNYFPTLNEMTGQGGMTSEEMAAMQFHKVMLQN